MPKKNSTSAFVPTHPSSAPGGYIASPELDRLNELARMAFDLEAVLIDRNAQVQGLRAAIATYVPEYANHAKDLLDETNRVEAGTRSLRDLEGVIENKVTFFKQAASFTAQAVPKNLDEFQLHAQALHERNKVEANKGSNRWRN